MYHFLNPFWQAQILYSFPFTFKSYFFLVNLCRDWFEDELRAFQGGKDGLMPCVWENELSSFPQVIVVLRFALLQIGGCGFQFPQHHSRVHHIH
jgi:hypothetical protein